MNLARHSRNQTQAPDFYRRFRRFDQDKTNGTGVYVCSPLGC